MKLEFNTERVISPIQSLRNLPESKEFLREERDRKRNKKFKHRDRVKGRESKIDFYT